MKKEDKLQCDIVLWFSQTYPEYYGSLWAVFNEDSKHKKALGMHAGASDLQFFANGIFAGIEIKAPHSVHKKSHIEQQIEWGENITVNGGYYCISADLELIQKFIISIIEGTINSSLFDFDVTQLVKKKTIKF